MFNYEPKGYDCSLCEMIGGTDNIDPWAKQSDVVYHDDKVTAWINPKWWGTIEGNAVVVPNAHVENIFDLSTQQAGEIHGIARDLAEAMMQTYGCRGISTRQHNGPDGNQDVWHYHLHVFPRFRRDDLYGQPSRLVPASARAAYADRIREWFAQR